MNYIEAGTRFLGLREDAGLNRDHSGLISAMLTAVGAEPGNPWCAALVSQAFRDAGGCCPNFPQSASSQAIMQSFDKRGLLARDAQAVLGWRGAIGGWTDRDCAHGHVFLITHRFTGSNGLLAAVGTIEGNTDGSGSADGNGCFAKRRALFSDKLFYPVDDNHEKIGPGHRLWFCNVSGIRGGGAWC